MEDQRYRDAETLLKTCISNPSLEDDQVHKARVALAVCYKEQKNIDLAKQTFLDLLESSEVSVEQNASISRHLADIYLTSDEIDLALAYALKACESQHNETQGAAYHDSCRLVVKAYQALGNFAEAAIYLEEIPAESRYRSKVSSRLVRSFEVDKGFLNGISTLSKKGQLAVSVGVENISHVEGEQKYQGQLYLWDMPQGDNRQLIHNLPTLIYLLETTQDGSILVFAINTVAKALNLTNNGIVFQETLPEGAGYRTVVLSPNGQYCILTRFDGQSSCFDFTKDKSATNSSNLDVEGRYPQLFSPDSSILATTVDKTIVELWRYPSFEFITEFDCKGNVGCLSFTSDGLTLAIGREHDIQIWDIGTNEIKKIFKGHSHVVRKLCFSPDGNLLASTSFDETIKLWETVSGRLLQTIFGHTKYIDKICFSPDGLYLVSGSTSDSWICLRSIEYD